MKKQIVRPLVYSAIAALSSLQVFLPFQASHAATFGSSEVDQSKFVAVAAPIGSGDKHQLLIIEQQSDERPCWEESGSNPVMIDPLLSTFNFAGICGRSVDANGYSIRVGEQDLGLRYRLRIRDRDGNLVLVGAPDNTTTPEIEIGSANGSTTGFAKIVLNSGWRFAKRTYEDKVLGHVYLVADSLDQVGETPPVTVIGDLPFQDVAGDLYLEEIRKAVELQFIKGFEDNTFRPRTALTREQIVSMILEAIKTLPDTRLNIPSQVQRGPYPDVDSSRWSAAKIAYAKENNIVSGYEDGNFRPTQAVTRAELMAILRRASEYALTLQGQDPELVQSVTPINFVDTSGHWARDLITQMSGFCGVASPLNESGQAFAPNQPGLRNYAAAATLRMLDCVRLESSSNSPSS
ncbi:DUF3747 domain-containing protein [Lyngbya confervoides]|uniref:DUF3747 domain-containing protein n=1 Tax=Lyngbya confervoides BDU141951 TaxID=1574623 RepID=A0ABD4T978_9CYAN|nr:DUF3747 domain-containing protein [Lyngbya confervoides]MCM1985359.1 DUF3747 domain-containing protein [Lyngbya confervoides BDU141951]